MIDTNDITSPSDLDWQPWVERWDRMQERYLVRRTEHLEVIARLMRHTPHGVSKVVDLGCDTGSLMLGILDAFPDAEVVGIDFDPTMLWLARARLKHFGRRSRIQLTDLRQSGWLRTVPAKVDAVVSATALHWLSPVELTALYSQIAQILRSGGIFLNGDHVGSDLPAVQSEWERHRADMREQTNKDRDDRYTPAQLHYH